MPAGLVPGICIGPRPLPASHGQYDAFGRYPGHAAFRINADDFACLGSYLKHHGIKQHLHAQIQRFFGKPARIFRPGQFLIKVGEAKSGMDTLLKDSSDTFVALNDQYISSAFLPARHCCRKSCRSSAYDCYITSHFVHFALSLLSHFP